MKGITIFHYQNRAEFLIEHPELKELEQVQIVPRGQTDDGIRQTLQRNGVQTKTAYTIGAVLYIPAAEEPLCACLEHPGDNIACKVHTYMAHGD